MQYHSESISKAFALAFLFAAVSSLPAATHTDAPGTPSGAVVHSNTSSSNEPTTVAPQPLPPLPRGVEELSFHSLFKSPAGPRGLEYSDQVRALTGKQVRMIGYMVDQHEAAPGCFLLSPRPLALHPEEYGLADDLPPTAVLVIIPAHKSEVLRHQPGRLSVVGRLEIGNREEADGRVSLIRLIVDSPAPDESKKAPIASPTKP